MDQYVSDLKAENARLTARVAAAQWMAIYAEDACRNPTDHNLQNLARAVREYRDVATAPADALGVNVMIDPSVPFGEVHIQQNDRTIGKVINATAPADIEQHEQRLARLMAGMDASYERSQRHEKAIDELWRAVKDAPNRQEITSLDKLLAKRLDELAARVQQAEGVARVSRDYVPKHTRRMDQMQREIDNLRKALEVALEAARQPQPQPSAPVTDEAIRRAMVTLHNHHYQTWLRVGSHEVRQVAEAVFAVRESEAGR